MIKIHPKRRRLIRSPKEDRFQRQLNIAFHQMNVGQFRFIRKLPGTIYTSVFPKDTNIVTVPPELGNLLITLDLDPIFAYHSMIRGQIYEYLKNSCAHGGDALVAARKYHAFRGGRIRKILEVIVWDNGPGIQNLKQALEQGYSSDPHPYREESGLGLGLDYIVSWGHYEASQIEFAADELIIETGRQKAYRKFNSDPHHFIPSGIKIPGTKITARFWL